MALPLLIGTCRLADLIVGPKGALLCISPVSPDTLRDSAPVGSKAPHANVIDVSNCGGSSELKWDADIKSSSPWVFIQPESGTVGLGPPVQVIFNPTGLDTGMHNEVAVVNSPAVSAAQELPLSFKVFPCKDDGISIGDTVTDTLTSAECGSPHRPGRYAKFYNFQGNFNDSVTIEVSGAAGFDAFVAIDSSKLSTVIPLDSNDACLGSGKDPCIYYYRLPRPGTATYYVEVTSADSADSGTFTLQLVPPRAPLTPTSLEQRLNDSVTAIAVGATVNATSVLLRAIASDPDLGDVVHLEAEVRPINTDFSGPNVPNGPNVANGQPAWVSTGTLTDKTSYHWRVRVRDNTGRAGPWDSLPGGTDFAINVPHPPRLPTSLAQAKGDGTGLTTGAIADTDVVILSATVSDQDPGDFLRLVVEVRPTTEGFSAPTDSSPPVQDGGPLQVTVGPLPNNTNFHWRARAVDQGGDTSSWVSFGNNGEGATDFRVVLQGVPNAPDSLAQYQSDGTTPIAVGDTSFFTTVVLKGKVSDPDVGQTVQLDVEVKPVGTDFIDAANYTSPLVPSNTTDSVTVGPLAINTCYHWQARAKDNTGRTGAWLSFPKSPINPEPDADFCVVTPPTQLQFTVQPPLSTVAGVTMSPAITVTAKDQLGNVSTAFTGDVVMTLENAGGATLLGTTTVTAVAGVATFDDLHINKAGSGYVLRATTASPSLTKTSNTFSITAAPTSQLVFTTNPPPSTQAGANMTAVVTAEDQFSNPTNFGGTVLVSIANNGGSPTPGNLTGGGPITALNGVANFSALHIDKTGSGYTLRATSPSQPSLTPDTSMTFSITPGPATHLAFTVQPNNAAANATIAPPVKVSGLDANDNVATSFTSNVTVAIGSNPGSGTLGGTLTQQASSGVATFANLSINKVGSGYTLTATSTVTGTTSSTFDVINSSVDPNTSMVVSSPTTITACSTGCTPASTASTITVTALDNGGNPVASVSATLTVTGGATIAPPGAVTTNASGQATWTLNSTAAGAKGISATAGGITFVDTATVNVSAAPVASLTITTLVPNTVAGAAINAGSNVVVTGRDQFGNTATSFTNNVTMAIASGPGPFAPTSTNTVPAVGGIANFNNLRIYVAGPGYTLRASSGALPPSAASNNFTISPAPAHHLRFTTPPTNTAVLARIDSAVGGVVVTVQDSVDNTVPFGGTVRVIMGNPGTNPGGGTLNGGTGIAAPTGIATFQNLTISAPGTGYTLQTTSSTPALIPDESNSFNITTGSAAKLAITTPPSSTVQSGVAFATQPVIQLQDANGFPVSQSGILVTATIATGTGAALSNATATTNASGAASFSGLTLTGLVGNFTLRFGSGSLTSVTSGNIALSAGPAAKLAITTPPSGAAQSGVAFAQQPVIQIQDASSNPVSQGGIVVTTTVATGPGGATLANATATSNPSGAATFSGLAINGLVGTYTLRFGATGLTPVTTGAITLSAGPASKLVITTPPSSTAQNGAVFAQQPVIQIEDANGNHVNQSGTLVTASIATGPGSASLTNATATTNSSGAATFSGLAITGPANSYTLAFAGGGLTPDTSGTITLTAGPATKLAITTAPSSSAQSGVAFAQQPVIQLQDVSGNPVSQNGVLVTATIASGPGSASLTNATATTNASGAATFSGLAITGPANSYTLSFGATSLTPATSGTITLSAGSATKLGITTQPSSSAQTGVAFAQQPVIQLQDAGGNPVSQSGVTVTATIASSPGGSPSLNNATATTNASGAATFSGLAINGPVGNYTLTFSSGSLTPITSGIIALSTGSATKLAITTTTSSSAQSGVAFAQQPVIQLQDAGGNPVSQSGTLVTATVGSGPGGATLSNATATTGVSGAATFSGLAINGLVGNYTLTFSATSLTPITSGTIALSAGAATKLGFLTQPTNTTGGTAIPTTVQVEIRDAGGNRVTTVPATTITIGLGTNPKNGDLTGTTSAATSNGLVSFSNLVIDSAATGYTLTASGTYTGATSSTFNVAVGSAVKVGFRVQPTSAVARVGISPAIEVELQDAGGNRVTTGPNRNVTITIANNAGSPPGQLFGANSKNTSNGLVNFPGLNIDKSGSGYTLLATPSGGGLATATSIGFDITHAGADHLVFSVQPSTTQFNQTITPAVKVEIRDAFDNLVTDATDDVTLVITNGTGTPLAVLGGTIPMAAVGGIATFSDLTIDLPGIGYSLDASASGITGVTSNTFDITP